MTEKGEVELRILFLVFCLIITYIKYDLVLFHILSRERVFRKYYVICILGGVIASAVVIYSTGLNREWLSSICMVALFLLMAGEMKKIRLDILLIVELGIWFLDDMVQAFIVYFTKVPLGIVESKFPYVFWSYGISLLCLFAIFLVLIKCFGTTKIVTGEISKKKAILVCFLILGLGGYFAGIQYELVVRNNYMDSFWVLCWSAISILTALFLLISWLIADASSKRNEEKYYIQKKLFALQKEYYQKSLEHEMEMRKIRHDIRHHMGMLKRLSVDEKYEELHNYIKSWEEQTVSQTVCPVTTGNEIVDIVVANVCDGIPFEWTGEIPKGFQMSMPDICVLFSNVLENAKEAVQKLEDKQRIEVMIRSHGENLYIQVSNPIDKSTVFNKKSIFQTDKDNKKIHGYGVKSIKDVVEKYQGTINFEINEEIFSISIFLPNITKK